MVCGKISVSVYLFSVPLRPLAWLGCSQHSLCPPSPTFLQGCDVCVSNVLVWARVKYEYEHESNVSKHSLYPQSPTFLQGCDVCVCVCWYGRELNMSMSASQMLVSTVYIRRVQHFYKDVMCVLVCVSIY